MQIAGCQTETAVYDVAITAARDTLDARDAVVAVRHAGDWTIVRRPDTPGEAAGEPIIDARITDAVDRGEAVILESTAERDRALCVPVGTDGVLELLGVAEPCTEEDRRYVELLASLVGIRLKMLRSAARSEDERATLGELVDRQYDVLNEASHQLRTPLTSVVGYAEMLTAEETGSPSDQQRELASRVLQKAAEMESILEWLDAAKPQAEVPAGERLDGSRLVGWGRLGSIDGPILLVVDDAAFGTALADRLRERGYSVIVTMTVERATDHLESESIEAAVVELFGDENDAVTEPLCRTGLWSDVSTDLISVFRDDPQDLLQLGVSAYLTGDEQVPQAASALLDTDRSAHLRVLVFDATSIDDEVTGLPAAWDVTVVTELDDELWEQTWDLGVVRTGAMSGVARDAVRTLRRRRGPRRLPVVLVHIDRGDPEPRYVVGGRQFIQRPLDVADLASALTARSSETSQNGSQDASIDRDGSHS